MTWNYRIVKQVYPRNEESFDVSEVYYDENGVPHSFAPGKQVLSGDSLEDLEWVNTEIQKAFQKPVLYFDGKHLIELEHSKG